MPIPEDLAELGRLLKRRREELGLRRSDVAHRVGVSPTYVALIEEAKPRPAGRGNPSRPNAGVLVAWTRALAMDEEGVILALRLAGHLIGTREMRQLEPTGQVVHEDQERIVKEVGRVYATLPWHLRRELLLDQLREVLALAERHQSRDELVDLLEGVLDVVRFRLEHE